MIFEPKLIRFINESYFIGGENLQEELKALKLALEESLALLSELEREMDPNKQKTIQSKLEDIFPKVRERITNYERGGK